METTPTPQGSVLYRTFLTVILLFSLAVYDTIGQSSTCVPNMVGNANDDIWSEECYLNDNCEEQGNPCQASDVILTGIFLADSMGNPLPPCHLDTFETVALWGFFNANATRYAVRARTELWINGVYTEELIQCAFDVLPNGVDSFALLGTFTYQCGDQIQLLNTWVAWDTNESQCTDPMGAEYRFDCQDYSPSKCSKNLDFVNLLSADFMFDCGGQSSISTQFCFTDLTTGATGPYTWNWDFGDGNMSTLQNPCHTYNGITGIFTVTLTVTDSVGNISEAFTEVDLADTTCCVLEITCPPMDGGIFSCATQIPPADPGIVVIVDSCGPVSITVENSTTGSGCGTDTLYHTRRYIVTNGINTDTCTQLFRVRDSVAPAITCPANVTVACANNVPPPNTSTVTASDNCGGPPVITFVNDVTVNQTCTNRYTLNRTYRATDGCSNSATCVQVITVLDNVPPSITCPANVTVSCIGNVPAININSVVTSDNCGGMVTVMHVSDQISGTMCTNRLTLTRTYRAIDVCGNSATCSQIIVVNDQTPPSITCPANITVMCASAVPAPNPASVTRSDNCGGTPTVTFVSDMITNQTCANRYTVTRTYRATDACGNSSTCAQTITVNDQTPPTITCPANVTVSCANLVPAPNVASVTTSDNCNSGVTVTHIGDVSGNLTCANRYTITRTYRAEDACGNSATCIQLITVNDQTPPSITCPDNITVSCLAEVPGPNPGSVLSGDNCGGMVSITHVNDVASAFVCPNGYTVTRTYRAMDLCGNSATCTQLIIVNDQIPPSITCPGNVTVSCASEVPAPDPGLVVSSDNCGGMVSIMHVNDVASAFVCPNGYTVTRTYLATDVCGNSSTCTQLIIVHDQVPPSITCPVNITVSCTGLIPPANPNAATASDNCGGVNVTHDGDVASNVICANRLTMTRTYRATDLCGNTATCQQVFTVFDAIPPVMTCADDITIGVEESTVPDNTGTTTATDNCVESPEITYDDVTLSGFCDGEYTIYRTWTAMDACGNASTCAQEIFVSLGCIVDLRLNKELSANQPMTFLPGENVNFTIEVTNDGNVPIGSLTIVDYIPIGFSLADPDWTAGTEGSTGQSASITLSIGNGELPPAGLLPAASVDIEITLASDPNLSGGFYNNIAEISEVYSVDGTDLTNEDTDSQPDTNDANDPDAEDDHDPAVLCVNTLPVILGNDIVCHGDITVYEVENYNPNHDYQWTINDGGFISDATDSTITITWFGAIGTTALIMMTEIAGADCQFSAELEVTIGDGGPMACLDHVNLSIDNDCGTVVVASLILTGEHLDNSNYLVYVITLDGDTLPNATVTWEHVGQTFMVSVRNRCSGQSCWGFITVEDKLPPIIACRCEEGEENERCSVSCLIVEQMIVGDIPDHLRPFVMDNCGGTTLEITNIELSYETCDTGHVVLEWLATDAMGNTATCVQSIQIIPLNLDSLTFPADYVGDCNGNSHPSVTGWPNLDGINLTDFTPSCNIMTWYDDNQIPLCGGGRKIIRRWTVTNWCNAESVVHIQQIFLKDRIGPVLSCIPDVTVSTDVWACSARVILQRPVATDACSDIISYQLVTTGGVVAPIGNQYIIPNLQIGVHTATWTVADECYNQSTCSIQITVVDNVPPVVSCHKHTVVSLTSDRPNGVTFLPAESLNDQSLDNCSNLHFRARRMDSCIDFDWTTLGACVDDIPGGIPAVNGYDMGTDYGSCIPVACCDIGTIVMVQLEVTDDAGNVNYCMVEVEVQDKLEPTLTCPPDIIISCEYVVDIEEGVYRDSDGNNDGSLDEDPLSEIFGNVYDAFRHPPGARANIVIHDPNNPSFPNPHVWGLDGWAVDNCETDLMVTVTITEDCSGNGLPGNAPPGAIKMIDRSFVGHDGVQSGSCHQRIWVVDFNRFTITDITCQNENPFDGVIWPCDVVISDCPDDITHTGEPVLFEDNCSLVGMTHEDQRYDFAEGACYKILREWKIIDWCQFDVNTGYGIWTYVQEIKVADAVGAEFPECPAGPLSLCAGDPGISLPDDNQLFLGEDDPDASSCSVHVRLTQKVRDLCSNSVRYDVDIYPFNGSAFVQIQPETELLLDENHEGEMYFDTEESLVAQIQESGLPYTDPACDSYHRVVWNVEDGCGNRTYCEFLFRLEDCKAPTPVCIDGLSAMVMEPDGEVTIWASDFNASSVDDCTPGESLVYSFSGTSHVPSFTYTCDNVPELGVPFDEEIWVADAGVDHNCNGTIEWSERNTDFCIASVLITDSEGLCDEEGAILEGGIMTEQTEAVSDVMVHLIGPGFEFPGYLTADEGKFTFGDVPLGLDYTISAERNDNPRNGVSTLDLVQIQKHLLGLDIFTSAYQYIAADANNSASVSAIDLLEIRKLILGLYPEFPNNTSWKFIQRANGELSIPPWPLTETISIDALQVDPEATYDFTGIKIGDINHSAIAHATQVVPRSALPVQHVRAVTNGQMTAGSIIECRFILPAGYQGFQWTLELNGLEYVGIRSESIPIDDTHVGQIQPDVLTMSWNGEPYEGVKTEDLSFIMRFKVGEKALTGDLLRMTSLITEQELYDMQGEIWMPKLEFDVDETFTEFALLQNKPNPWNGHTLIEFDLPSESPSVLTIYDVTGKVVKTVGGTYKAGRNSIMLNAADIPSPGVLYYRLDSGGYSSTKKMMIIR